jgi:hypothetical protein
MLEFSPVLQIRGKSPARYCFRGTRFGFVTGQIMDVDGGITASQ